MLHQLAARLRGERGDALIEGMLALGLVLLVVWFAAQAVAYVHARNIAEAAAQDGASDAASGGPQAGIQRAEQILTAAGGASSRLHASASSNSGEITITVQGDPPRLFSLPLLLPSIHAAASLPLEQYPADEQAVTP
jgi:hypothetical protein